MGKEFSRESVLIWMLLSLLFLATNAFYNSDFSALVAFFLTLIIGQFFVKFISHISIMDATTSRQTIKLFFVSFSLNTITLILFTLYFKENSSYGPSIALISGGDAYTYYKNGLSILTYGVVADHEKYIGYVYTLAGWFGLVKFFSAGDLSYISATMLNVMISSFQPFLVYLIVYRIYDDRKSAALSGMMTVFWGVYIYYSAVLLRDNIVVTLMLCILVCVTCIKSKKKPLAIVVTILLMTALWLYRADSLYLLLLSITVYFFDHGSLSKKMLVILLMGIFILLSYSYFETYLSLQVTSYSKGVLQSSEGLGRHLYSGHGFFFVVATFLYTLLLSIPPISMTNSEAPSWIMAIGVIEWYFLAPFYLWSCFSVLKRSPQRFLLIGSLALIMYGVFVPLGMRYMMQVAVIMFMLAIANLGSWKKKIFKIFYYGYLFLFSTAFLVYIFLQGGI